MAQAPTTSGSQQLQLRETVTRAGHTCSSPHSVEWEIETCSASGARLRKNILWKPEAALLGAAVVMLHVEQVESQCKVTLRSYEYANNMQTSLPL